MSVLTASPCCVPQMPLHQALEFYRQLGVDQYEVFTTWVKSAYQVGSDPRIYRAKLQAHGLSVVSFHLPRIETANDATFELAVQGAYDAKAMGATYVIFKADSRDAYVSNASRFLDATAGLGLTTVIQNQINTPIATLDNYREVLERTNDNRLRALLEVGHFHKGGIHWEDAYELLRGRVSLVHIKDIKDGECVPYGSGEVDFQKLVAALHNDGYDGTFVVEQEDPDPELRQTNTVKAFEYMRVLLDQREETDDQPASRNQSSNTRQPVPEAAAVHRGR